MLLICAYFPNAVWFLLLSLQHALSGSRYLRINTHKQTRRQTATRRRTQTHTQKRAAGKGRGRSHHANHCRLSRRVRNQKINEKADGGGWARSKRRKTWKQRHCFSKGFFVVDLHWLLSTLAWPWRRAVWRAIGHCKGHQDKHMASGTCCGFCMHIST